MALVDRTMKKIGKARM